MNAFDELSSYGEIGQAGRELFLAKARRVVDAHGFPPPDGHARWLDDDIEDLVHGVFAKKSDPRAITVSLLACPTQDAVEATITTIIHNHLKDEAKATEVGKLRRRLDRILRMDDRFAEAPRDWWGLAGGPVESTTIGLPELQRAAYLPRGVTLELPLNPAGPTSARNVEALTTIAQEVLTAAAGAVHIQGLARAVAPRCGLLVARPVPLYDARGREVTSEIADADPSAAAARRATALGILSRLDAQERKVIELLAADETSIASALGVGRRQAKTIRERVEEEIKQAVEGDDDLVETLAELVTLITPGRRGDPVVTSSEVGEAATAASSNGEVAR